MFHLLKMNSSHSHYAFILNTGALTKSLIDLVDIIAYISSVFVLFDCGRAATLAILYGLQESMTQIEYLRSRWSQQ